MSNDDEKTDDRKARHQTAVSVGRERLDDRIQSLYDVYDDINDEIVEMADAIREGQPRKPGAVLLELNRCGQHGCVSCPHARWQKWATRKAKKETQKPYWFSVNITQPLRHARSKQIPQETREAIAHAQALLEKKRKLMERLRALNRTVATIEQNRFGDEDETDQDGDA